jgi:hypothetical protein
MYAALVLNTSANVKIDGIHHKKELPFSDMIDGCVGVLPIFETEEDLKKAFPNAEIVELELGE